MSKSDVIKKLTFLAVIGAAIGALVVFLKKRSREDYDIFEEDDDEDISSCPGCQEAERNYTTISKDIPSGEEDEISEEETSEESASEEDAESPEEAASEETEV